MSPCRRMLPRAALLTLLFTGVSVSLLAFAGWASAETVHPSYGSSALTDATGRAYSCMTWSGGTDGAGNAYIPCNRYIYVIDMRGRLIKVIPVPAGLPARRDVAVSTNGNVIYYVSGALILDDPVGNHSIGAVQKLVRGSDGVYRHDASFRVGPIQFGAVFRSVRNIDVDLKGNLYASSNAYVFVYDPRGRRIAAMGGDDRFVNGQYVEGLEVAAGLAVTRDGNHIYVVEQRRNHVQRWDRTFDGRWVRSPWQLGSHTEVSNCADTNRFASPYDVGLDGSGNLLVLDVTCRRIQRYNGAGRFLGTVWGNYTNQQPLYHGMAVDYRGNVLIAEQGRRYSYRGPLHGCRPDNDAPRITRTVAPSSSGRRANTVHVTARDHCSSVRSVRVYGATTTGSQWRAYRARGTSVPVYLTGGTGNKTLFVAVRDTYGRLTVRTVTIRYTATGRAGSGTATSRPAAGGQSTGGGNGRIRPRARIHFAGVSRYCVADPLKHISRGASYRVSDRCATFRARLLSRTSRNGATILRVRVSTRPARRMFENARGPMEFYVTGRSSISQPRRLRVGSDVVITGALVTDRRRTWLAMAPTGQWTRA